MITFISGLHQLKRLGKQYSYSTQAMGQENASKKTKTVANKRIIVK